MRRCDARCPLCTWQSMKPGETSLPRASISRSTRPSNGRPTCSTRSSSITTTPSRHSVCVPPSKPTTHPPVIRVRTSARRLERVAPRLVGLRTRDQLALGESLRPERADVDAVRAAFGDQLGHARAYRRRDLEARAAERRREVEPVDPGRRAEDRVAIGAVTVERAIAAGELGALSPQDARDRRPLADLRAARLRLPPEAFNHVGRARVAARRLIGGGADVVHVDEGLQRLELVRRQRDGVDADAAQHQDVALQRAGILRPNDREEAGAPEDGRPAHALRPVAEERIACPRQPRVLDVGVVHTHERARAAGGAAGQRALLEEDDALDAGRRQRERDAGTDYPATDHDHVRGHGRAGFKRKLTGWRPCSESTTYFFTLGRILSIASR